ncbi:MAG TPA: transposase [Kofleriaceae bacterium]|jgi:REP element-mobilizing transposase RayT
MKRQTEMVFRRNRFDISHHARPFHDKRHPVHVMLRVRGDVPGLRQRRLYHALRTALRTVATREDFRVVHMSIQASHLHLIVEASSARSLSRGMQGLTISAAKRINRALGRRGSLFAYRYKAVPLTCRAESRSRAGASRSRSSIRTAIFHSGQARR